MSAPGKLYVVTAVYNPCRYQSRYRLYRDFARHVENAGAVLYTVEAALHERPFEVTEAGNPCHVQVRVEHELWLKENLWNVGIARLPAAAAYVATVDADFAFTRPDWSDETVQQLQHYRVVQMFSNVCYLGPDFTVRSNSPGFAFAYKHGNDYFKNELSTSLFAKFVRGSKGGTMATEPNGSGARDFTAGGLDVQFAAPGGAWAYRRSALDGVGLLIDTAILGSADMYMAMALVGRAVEVVAHRDFHPEYKQVVTDWGVRAERWLRRDVGVVSGTALHHWHGPMDRRGYGHRDDILVRNRFNPRTDLKKDCNGVWQLEDDGTLRFCQLRDDIRSYFRMRNEDSVDL